MNSNQRATSVFIAIIAMLSPALALAGSDSFRDIKTQMQASDIKAAEADGRLHNVTAELNSVRNRISATQSEIAQTNAGIADAKARMAAQQVTLGELMRTQYQQTNQTKLEQLVGSKTLADFVQREQYLEAGQDKIAKAVEEVIKTKKILEARSAELNKLNTELAAAQNGLAFAQAQASNDVAQVAAAKAALKEKLKKYSGGRVVASGERVKAGDLIGFEGSTGYSTGSHLHYEIQENGNPVNPRNYSPGRFRWPYDGGFNVNQEYGPPNWAAAYNFHTGIDIGQYYGAPIYAAASGTVTFAGFDNSGFGESVRIDHGGGVTSIYGHMAQGQ